MLKVYLDASVIIAALLSSSGGSAKVIQIAKLAHLALITSQNVVEEVEEHSLKIKRDKKIIQKFIAHSGILVRERILLSAIESVEGIDLEDRHLIAGAKLTECNLLVTLDKKHLLKGEVKDSFKPLKIVTPGELLENLV
ncbi:MAG: PIN domain-containing protein [bacterium]|nr:PIN domain-containing protein [bacterium]